MGVKFDYARPAHQPETARQRLTTQGMDHIYVSNEPVQVEVVESSVVVDTQIQAALEAPDVEALQAVITEQLEQIDEQTRRLEAASYRIGYLEAQLGARDEQVKLLTTSVSSSGWWHSVCQWFK